jgi:uncharacterized protein YndB with AHSA1/START domain
MDMCCPERVWVALTDPRELTSWLGPVTEGAPGPDASFVLAMDVEEVARCTVTAWRPPYELRMVWDYTGEGPSELAFLLEPTGDGTLVVVEHHRIAVDPIQYGAGWHAYLEALSDHLDGQVRFPDGASFMAAFRDLERAYAQDVGRDS